LVLIGLKLLFLHWAEARFNFQAGEFVVLGAIGTILLISVLASIIVPQKPELLLPKAKSASKRRRR
jgi:hypothetical protein